MITSPNNGRIPLLDLRYLLQTSTLALLMRGISVGCFLVEWISTGAKPAVAQDQPQRHDRRRFCGSAGGHFGRFFRLAHFLGTAFSLEVGPDRVCPEDYRCEG